MITTKEYRAAQLEKVSTVYSEYPTKIKIIKPDGETNWIDITEEELKEIRTILTAAKPETAEEIMARNMCPQCKKNTAFLSDVCGSCARKNHRKAMGK